MITGYRLLRAGVACFLIALLAGWTMATRADAAISVTVDRDDIREGESFVLTFEAEQVDGNPDFSPLERDFDLLGSSQRSNLSFVNGRFSKSTMWQLNLLPKRAGEVVIPAIHFGKDQSKPFTINVGTASGNQGKKPDTGLRLEVQATPKRSYVQAQVLLTVRIYAPEGIDLVNTAISDPRISGGDALVTALGKPRERVDVHDNKTFRVIERQFAVFPQRHGKVTVEPFTFEGQLFEGSASLLNPFGQRIRTYRLRSEPIALDIRPMPASFKGKHWLPAASLQINDTWSEEGSTLRAGEPITRTLSLLAKGMTAGQLPEISPPMNGPVKIYPEPPVLDDQARSDGVNGLRMEKIAIIANTEGIVTVPEIRIPWWNTETDRAEQAVLPARTFKVIGATPSAAAPPTSAAPAPLQSPSAIAKSVTSPGATESLATSRWVFVCTALGTGWAVTLLLWWWRASGSRMWTRRVRGSSTANVDVLAKAVLHHSHRHDATATRTALVAWAEACGLHPADLDNIARRLPQLAAACADLNRSLYGQSAAKWNGDALAAIFADSYRDFTAASVMRRESAKSHLAPLYLSQ